MKKKIAFGILAALEALIVIMVYIVRGGVAPWVWSASIFIIGPIAAVAFAVQAVIVIIRLVKRKDTGWNFLFILMTLILAYPVTILFGQSPLRYPRYESKSSAVRICNPVDDGILFGGKDYKQHAVWASECYAYDIVKEPHDIGSDRLEDYGIYLADVKSPVTGEVIGVCDEEEDIAPNTDKYQSFPGNYVYIKIKETGTYMILAHLEKGSITVSVGDTVEKGQIIAKVGNSGTTTEPHLHIQHQKNDPRTLKLPICAEGLPMVFE